MKTFIFEQILLRSPLLVYVTICKQFIVFQSPVKLQILNTLTICIFYQRIELKLSRCPSANATFFLMKASRSVVFNVCMRLFDSLFSAPSSWNCEDTGEIIYYDPPMILRIMMGMLIWSCICDTLVFIVAFEADCGRQLFTRHIPQRLVCYVLCVTCLNVQTNFVRTCRVILAVLLPYVAVRALMSLRTFGEHEFKIGTRSGHWEAVSTKWPELDNNLLQKINVSIYLRS